MNHSRSLLHPRGLIRAEGTRITSAGDGAPALWRVGDWQPSPWREGLNRNRQSQDDGGMKTGSTWLCAVPVAHNVSVMVRAPACGALGYVNAEEFEQLSTNGPCGK